MGCASSGEGKVTIADRILFAAPEVATYGEWSYKNELIWIPLWKYCGVRRSIAGGSNNEYSFPCRLLKHSSARYLVIYFHRNGDDLGLCCSFVEKLQSSLQVHVLAVEYPGYGLCDSSRCTAAQVNKHAAAALAFAQRVLGLPLERVLLFGDCVGVGPVFDLASKAEVAGLVLVAPFLSARKLFRDHVGCVARLATDTFPNESLAHLIRSPTLIFHGTDDKMTPVAHSIELDRLLTCKSRLVIPQDVGHQVKLTDEGQFLGPLREFFGLPGNTADAPVLRVPDWAYRRHPPADLEECDLPRHDGAAENGAAARQDSAPAPAVPPVAGALAGDPACGVELAQAPRLSIARSRSRSWEATAPLVPELEPQFVRARSWEAPSPNANTRRAPARASVRPAGTRLTACCCPAALV